MDQGSFIISTRGGGGRGGEGEFWGTTKYMGGPGLLHNFIRQGIGYSIMSEGGVPMDSKKCKF